MRSNLVPFIHIYVDGKRCRAKTTESTTPFISLYSFLSAEAIPSILNNQVWGSAEMKSLVKMCTDPIVIASGARCLLGSEESQLTCANNSFLGSNETSMLILFLATPNAFHDPLLGQLKAETKHFITVSRINSSTFWICVYEGLNPPVGPPPDPANIVAPKNVSATSKKPRACLPENASVRLNNGSYLPMAQLEIGHVVDIGGTVFMFTHQISEGFYNFLRISLDDGRQLRVSEGHHVYITDCEISVPARDVQIGDRIDSSRVVLIEITRERGLYNPQTIQGDIVVDDVRISTYTEVVRPIAAHTLLAPVRALYRYIELVESIFYGYY